MNTTHKGCGLCEHFDPIKGLIQGDGLCRFNPPVVVTNPDSLAEFEYKTVWPSVSKNAWCGSWQPKR